jgi:hypothetical protein
MNTKLAPHAAANNTNWVSTTAPLTCLARTTTTSGSQRSDRLIPDLTE